MALKAKGKRAIQAAVDTRRSFRHETLSARWVNDVHLCEWGQLPAAHMKALAEEIDACGSVFVIFSYDTPIAWKACRPIIREWCVPDVKYSVTTTNHQNVVRTAVDNPGFYSNARW